MKTDCTHHRIAKCDRPKMFVLYLGEVSDQVCARCQAYVYDSRTR